MLDITENMGLIEEQPDPMISLLLGSMAAGGLANIGAGDAVVNAGQAQAIKKGKLNYPVATSGFDDQGKAISTLTPENEKALRDKGFLKDVTSTKMESGENITQTTPTFIDPETGRKIQPIDESTALWNPGYVKYDDILGSYTPIENIKGSELNIFEQIITNPATYLGAAGMIAGPAVASGIRLGNAARTVDSLSK